MNIKQILTSSQKNTILLGAIVADCATMPLHWIYDTDKLKSSIVIRDNSDDDACEFNSVASCPFYSTNEFPGHYKVGQPSPYGEQLIGMHQIVSKQMHSNANNNTGDAYAIGFNDWLLTYGGRIDSAGKAFQEKMKNGATYPECGIDDDQAMSLYKAVIAAEMDSDDNYVELERLVRFLQNNDMAVACANVLLTVLKNLKENDKCSIKDSFDKAKASAPALLRDHLSFMEDNLSVSTEQFLSLWSDKFNPGTPYYIQVSCHNPQALLRVLHVSLRATSYEDGVRQNILIGGDNASTGIGIGAILATRFELPQSWIDQSQF